MKKRFYEVFLWTITILFIIGIFFMPETVPVHWNEHWEVDGYGSRYTVIIIALLPMLIYYGMILTKKIDPKKNQFQSREKTYDLFRYGLSLFFIALCTFLYYMTFFPESNGQIILFCLFGIMMIGVGNYMPRIPQNYFLGIKTPWTLADEYVWKKTHKIGGYAFVIEGLIILLYGLFDLPYGVFVIVGTLLIEVAFTFIYSYVIYKNK